MPTNASPVGDRQRIVAEVFALRHSGARRRWAIATLVVAGAFSTVFVGLCRLAEPSGADWASAVAARVRAELDRAPEVTIEPPPPPPAQQPPVATSAARAPRPTTLRKQTSTPVPAQTAQVIARDPNAQPLDFTASTFVSGKSAAYAGGASSAAGTSAHSVDARAIAPAAGDPSSRRRTVSLDDSAWSCPWPSEAEGTEIHLEMVVLQVFVRSNGSAEEVKVVTDPGSGFGAAARACALRTHFRPALDDGGAATAAWSPPIRVRFVR